MAPQQANQIPYDYTVEVTNRFKGLDLRDRVPENCGWRFMTLYRRQWSILKKKKGKMAVWGGLTNSWEKKRSKKQRRKGKIYPFECRVPKNSKERLERLPQRSMQRNRGKQQNRKDYSPLQENQRYQGNVSCKDGHNKEQKWCGPNRSRRY